MSALLVLYVILGFSYVLGLPVARWLLDRGSSSPSSRTRSLHIFLLSPILGFTGLVTAVYSVSQLLWVGTDLIARPTAAALLVAALIASARAARKLTSLLVRQSLSFVPAVVAAPLAGFNVLFPIIVGHWEMAYSTGNDSTRYLMMVTYLRSNPWDWFHIIRDPLYYGLIAHVLDHQAGATFASLFGIDPALANSLVAVVGSVLGAAAFCLLFEAIFAPTSWIVRYAVGVLSVGLFGFWGITTDIYYTGFMGQHFSIMPVLAALCFPLLNSAMRRFLWHVFWCAFLALAYSISLTASYAIAVGIFLLLPTHGVSWLRRLAGHFPGVVAGVMLALSLDPAERSMLQPGMDMAFSSRDDSFRWPLLETVLRWSGVISRYEPAAVLSMRTTVLSLVFVALVLTIAAVIVVRLIRREPALASIWVAIGGVPALALAVGHTYVAEKTSLYIGFPVALGVLGVAAAIWQSTRGLARASSVPVLLPLAGLIAISMRLIPFYWDMADERGLKVDAVTADVVQAASTLPAPASGRPTILAIDFSPERHLLLRELFRDYDWQPVRDETIWGEFYWTDTNYPPFFDNYAYAGLLSTMTAGCDPLDNSGNASALVFSSPRLSLYGPLSSTLQPLTGVRYESGPWIMENKCTHFILGLQGQVGRFIFVNNGAHTWLTLTLGSDRKTADITNRVEVRINGQRATLSTTRPGPDNWTESDVQIPLPAQRLVQIEVDRGNLPGQLGILSARWEY